MMDVHSVFIGAVASAGFGNAQESRPLIWLDGKYTSLDDSAANSILLTSLIA